MKSTKSTILLMALFIFVGCAFVQPAMRTQPISTTSLDNAIRAATKAARETNFVVKTVDKENGYIYAERDVRVAGRSGRADSYKLEINISNPSASGRTELNVKVTPPPGVMGGQSPEDMIAEYLRAFEKHSM